MSPKLWPLSVIALSLCLACGQGSSPSPPPDQREKTVSVAVEGQGGSVRVDGGGVDARGEGGSVSVGHGGVDIDVPGTGVQVGGGGVDLSGVPGMGSVGVHANVDVGAYLEGLEPVEVPGITVPGVEVRQGRGRTIYFVSGDVLFDFDKSDLRLDARVALEQVARSLEEQHPGSRVLVEGYTDAKGRDEYNRKLSLRRAESVKKWLTGAGRRAASEVEVKGRGEENPVAPNTRPDGSDDPAGRQKNRRVEISVPD